MLDLALLSLISHNSRCLHISQCFHCVKTNNGHKTRFSRKITRFSAFNVVLAEKTRLNAGMLVLTLIRLILHNSLRLHVSQCVHCVETDNMQKKRVFSPK